MAGTRVGLMAVMMADLTAGWKAVNWAESRVAMRAVSRAVALLGLDADYRLDGVGPRQHLGLFGLKLLACLALRCCHARCTRA